MTPYQRPVLLTESNNWANFSQRLGYDTLGRLASDQRSAAATGATAQTVSLQHRYAANGMLSELVEMSSSSPSPPSTGSGGSGGSGHSFWKLKAENARGQCYKPEEKPRSKLYYVATH